MLENRLAKLVAFMAFLMLIIGGTVNATGSSLACEWSVRCNDHFFPTMSGGVLYEHGHRQFGWILGLLQIALTVTLWRRRPAARRLAILTLVMVCVQGVLGMVTVKYKLPWIVSTIHLLHGMAYFGVLLVIAYLTRPVVGPLPEEANLQRDRVAALGVGRRWVLVVLGMLFVQITLGGLVRHFEATLACLDMPSCQGGAYWSEAFVQRIHMIHRGFGCLTALVMIVAAVAVWRRATAWPALRALMVAAPIVVAGQVTLGIYTVLTLRAVPVAVAHFAGATTLWGIWLSALLLSGAGRRILPGASRGAMIP
ncbi:MAG: COX15/CtaA family protein [Kofleriaceae bacterium]